MNLMCNNAITGKKNCLFKGEKVVVNRSFNAYEGKRVRYFS